MLLNIDYQPCQGRVDDADAYLTYAPRPPLQHWLQCFWQLNVPAGRFAYRSVPDACVDWIIDLNDPHSSFLVAPFDEAIVFELEGPASFFGLRFRLLGQQGVIAMPLGEWAIDAETAASEVMPLSLSEPIHEALAGSQSANFHTRCAALEPILLGRVTTPVIDRRLSRFVRACCDGALSNENLVTIPSECGISPRQLRRLSRQYLGLSPKVFSQVLRFQRVLGLMRQDAGRLQWLDAFYDQPHFIRSFKRHAGVTPREFQRLSVLYNTTRLP